MSDYQIKPVTPADVAELQAISKRTFKKTFDPFTAPDDMADFLETAYATEQLTAEINNPHSRFFFLIVDNTVAGYLKVNDGDAQTEQLKENALEVERIYLDEQFQHQGLGLVLIKYAEKLARQEKRDFMWLGCYEKNFQAQTFYARDGFVRESQHIYQVGTDPQLDYLLVKQL